MDRSSPDGWTGLAYTVLQLPSSEDTGFRQFLGTLLPSFVPLHQGCSLKSKGGPCTWMDIGHSESCTQGNFKSFLKAAVKSPVKLHFLVPYRRFIRLLLPYAWSFAFSSALSLGQDADRASTLCTSSGFLLPPSSFIFPTPWSCFPRPPGPTLTLSVPVPYRYTRTEKNICPQEDV